MGFAIKKLQQLSDPAIVEFSVDIVEQKEWIFAASRVKNGDICELEQE